MAKTTADLTVTDDAIAASAERTEDVPVNPAVPDDADPAPALPGPTQPGFYTYTSREDPTWRTSMVFLHKDDQWYVIHDGATLEKCAWGYIEQGLGVYRLEML